MDDGTLDAIVALTGLVASVPALGFLGLREKRRAWQAIAARVGGRYRPQGLFFVPPAHRIDVTLDGVPVTVTASGTRTAPLSQPGLYTRVAASAGELRGASLSVASGKLAPLARLAFAHDVDVAERDLQVVALRPAQVVAWLDEPACAALRGCPGWLFTVDGAEVVLARAGFETEVDLVVAAIRALPVLAGAVSRWRARWDEAAEAVGAMRVAEGRYERARRGALDRIEVAADASVTRLVAERARAAATPVDPPALPAIDREAGVRRIDRSADRVTVEIDAARPDARSLRAALALLEELAPGSAAAYR